MTAMSMKANTVGLVISLLLCAFVGISATDATEPSFWSFAAKDATGKELSMETFRSSKAILIVNVASACGYTDQNYRELQVLYDKYHPKGLEIIAFPCNQFGQQEPNAEPEILRFVKDHYHVSFPVMAKIDVNGENAHPLFAYLQNKLPGFVSNAIKWNFTKFLVVDGVPTTRYATTTSPLAIEQDIVAALGLGISDKSSEL
ncbi:hypothetical protein P43SY_007228 [Pythium insidiosum]|uniref:Glutathione peroxidase n=1 Tax=Pythium insidiosum TaxID=114742 RepID=A0AAD5L926_PYTIN|nr:hypothetical protein P43SY_007228 [Pythium insidiosum]